MVFNVNYCQHPDPFRSKKFSRVLQATTNAQLSIPKTQSFSGDELFIVVLSLVSSKNFLIKFSRGSKNVPSTEVDKTHVKFSSLSSFTLFSTIIRINHSSRG